MAATCLRPALLLARTVKINGSNVQVLAHQSSTSTPLIALSQLSLVRHGSFFNRKDSTQMWDSATGVSNAGRKRGRASRGKIMQRVNLNIGKKMGIGASGYVFPGLSTHISGKENVGDLGVRIADKQEDITDSGSKFQRKKTSGKQDPLDRGFSGTKLPGKKIEPPDPVDGYDFSDFETYIMESKIVSKVTRSQGKVSSHYAVVATGNRKGLFGIATGRGRTTQSAINAAKNRAAQRLVYIDILDGHTPLHNFANTYHKTSVIVYQAPKGFGLRCHPALRIICRLIGIKDVHIKSEGCVRNYLNLSRALMMGIIETKTHQEIADELGHHIVECRPETDYFPVIKASPSENAEKNDFVKQDGFDFDSYCFNNKLPLKKYGKRPFYWFLPAFKDRKARDYQRRNQPKAMIDRMVLGLQPEFKRLK